MSTSLTTTRRVEFRDTDAAGIMHFSVFFTAMESAEQEYLRSRGLSVVSSTAEGEIGWPRVSVSCDYQSPLRFEDEYQITVVPARIGSKSVTYEFTFTLQSRPVAVGKMTSVCCRMEGGTPVSMAIPPWILERLRGNSNQTESG